MLSVNSTNYKPVFGSNRVLKKAGKFAKNQIEHVATQATVWGLTEAIQPSPDLQSALVKKVSLDLGEALSKFIVKKPSSAISEIKTGNQCTNVFAYLADGIRAISKVLTKK